MDFCYAMNILHKAGNVWEGIKSMMNYGSVSAAGLSTQMPNLTAAWGQYADANLINLYHTVGEIYIPVHLIAAGVASGVVTLRSTVDDSVIENNKYVNALLSQPNPLQNWAEMIYQREVFELITGKSFVYANVPDPFPLNYRNIATLINLPSDQVQICTDMSVKLLSATALTDLIKEYTVPNGSAGITKIPTEKVLYTKEPSLKSVDLNIIGCSRLMSVGMNVDNLVKVYEARNVIYANRGALVIISSAKTDASGGVPLTKGEKEALATDFDSYGVTKGKKPFVLTNAPISATNIGASIKDMEPFRETLADAEVIFGLYGVPGELMPRSDGATFENQKEAEKRLYNKVIIPRAKTAYKSLTNFLKLNEINAYLHVSFDHIPVLQENLKEKSEVDWKNNETYRVAFLHGRVTLNDWRVAFKQQPVTGNKLYDKLVFEMDETEITQVEKVVSLSHKGGNSAAGNNQTDVTNTP